MFVTAVYGVLSVKTGDLTYANAGHNPPLWIHTETQYIEPLTRTGMALGVVSGAPIEARTIHLESKDNLLLYTDGVTEAFSSNAEIFGEERLRLVIKSHASSTMQVLLDAIEEAVDDFIKPLPATDDLTMLALRRLT